VLRIRPIGDENWETIIPPATVHGGEVRLHGFPASPTAYGVVSKTYRLSRGMVAAASGTIEHGGLTFGLLDASNRWAASVSPAKGPFRAAVTVPADGDYRLIVANNVPPGQRRNAVTVTRVGLINADPAAFLFDIQNRPLDIIALGPTTWETVISPARLENGVLRMEGVPLSPVAYAAVSSIQRMARGVRVAAAGRVRAGGIVLGLLDHDGQWAATTAIHQGAFRTAVEVPADGEYRIVITNNLPAGQQISDAEVTSIGTVPERVGSHLEADQAGDATVRKNSVVPPVLTGQ
jgi:hypothetical protein